MSDIYQRITETVDTVDSRLVSLAEALHAHPELSYEERFAADRVASEMEAEGFEIELGIAGLETAFIARYPDVSDGPTIALLAEYDALPELGHACGHNLIAGASVGAAIALAKCKDSLPGRIILIGTPAEEVGGGKVDIVRSGVFNGVSAAMMMHPGSATYVSGGSRAFADIELIFKGKAAHAASSPREGVNALEAVLLTFAGVNALRQYLREDAHLCGIVKEGGVRPNVVPDKAVAHFYVRAADGVYVDTLVAKLVRCGEGAALSTGASLEVHEIGNRFDALHTNETMAGVFAHHLSSLGIPVESSEGRGGGSTDMGDVSCAVPSIHPHVSISENHIVGHSTEFAEAANSEFGKRSMVLAAKALALTAADLMMNPELMRAVRSEFDRTINPH